jgi:hypothetical protein
VNRSDLFFRAPQGAFRFLAVALCGAALLAPVAAQGGERNSAPAWPFGGASFDGLDLYNLGILGAKASDAAKPPPSPRTNFGRKEVRSSGNENQEADVGPPRLRVEMLFPDGAAARAGLKPVDVIVGVEGGPPFAKGSLAPLATALRKAESSTQKPVVTLLLEGEKGKTRKLPITLVAAARAEFVDPQKALARAGFAAAACDWLAAKQAANGGFPETLGGKMGAVVQTSVAGLAWLAAGSTSTQGKYAAQVAKARTFVSQNVGKDDLAGMRPPGGANWNQENWGWCHALLFLAELQLRDPSDANLADVKRCAEAIRKNQETSGGWAHGPGGPNGLGYVELNIMAALALGGLGLAKQCGAEIPAAVVQNAVAYIEDSSSGGGVGYSTKPGQKGQGNIGRSAGCWLGYRALGLEKRKACDSMRGYVARSIGDVLGGHASLMQQTLLAGVAAAALGGDVQKRFWAALEDDVTLARAPDGSLQPRPWHESVSLESNSDVSAGQVWTTACWAIVLAADAPEKGFVGLPGWAGLKKRS